MSLFKMASTMRNNTIKAMVDKLVDNSGCDKTMIIDQCLDIQDDISTASNSSESSIEVKLEIKSDRHTDGEYTCNDIYTIRQVFELLGYKVAETLSYDGSISYLYIEW